jgi:cellulose synthase/poly-beta-1,6-N-acetylglucosamine synthase-like glycosyltransferase
MIENILQALLYPFLFLSLYFQVLLLLSFFEGKRKIKKEEHRGTKEFPTVTIAVPCWNEEKTLAGTLDSLLKLDYPHDKLSIVVVDDGSKDDTLRIAREYESRNPGRMQVIAKENGGKHTAVNLALASSTSDLFGCLDADSFVAPKTLSTIVSYFEHDSEVMAVTPCIHILRPKTLVQRIQAIEYLMGVFLRKAYGELDAIQVTPGPFSIFRKEVFEKIGPYHKAHNTEDFEITLRMHKAHLKIVNSHKALVYTVGPATARGYFHQRLRWARGFLENSLDYKELFFKREYGNLGMITLPFAFLFVFYTVYVAFVSVYSFVNEMSDAVTKWLTVGIHPQVPSFDMFYFNTAVMSFVAMIMFMLFLVVLYIGNTLSNDKQQFYKNFPVFIVLYPIFVPLFLGRALFDTFAKRKNEWVLQDTKK